jgi:alkylation response protein AidB-like acyl-CoA dehydrogenase
MPRPFEPTERAKPILERVRAFVDERLVPCERDLLDRGFVAMLPRADELRREAKERRIWAPFLPPELGGAGLGLTDYALVSEILGRTPLGHYALNCQAPDVGNMELLHQFGTEEQKARWLGPLARGEIRSCFGMTEPEHAGSNPIWLSTAARKDGDDYVIDGHKWFTTGIDGAAFCIVMAVTDPDAPSHARASQIIVPVGTPGLTVVRHLPVMGEPGGGWASHSEIRLENVRVPETNRIGVEGAGFLLAQERLGPGRIHHAMRWIGIMERAFEMMIERCKSRELGPGKPLGAMHTVQSQIAETRATIDQARLTVLDCAHRIDQDGQHAARDAISLVKVVAARALGEVLDRAIQLHGGLGLLDDLPLAYWWRHERAARIYDGPDEVHLAAVGKRILERAGMPRKKG